MSAEWLLELQETLVGKVNMSVAFYATYVHLSDSFNVSNVRSF